ncbi:MAG: class I SAM-dependent methyltransferase [Xanthomonadales bacterium]|nr:class I SAM-dependent methyltransferase [Gammaproteobacteria bacterium]NND56629.1 class I SAM-dependent methyltransferase [Xanthomonadales bacterium]NNK52429.1 class I SAM-dependent methyltransferase [Xanthomonadales bacterium]
MSQSLDFTGERFTPECVREIWYEHLHRYVFARELVAGLNVLDAACGEGYGAAILAGPAASVTGVDLSPSAIDHACKRYRVKNLDFQVADCLSLPFADEQFDCIVSFETLEHLEDHQGLMNEFRRVLRPQGILLLSSPDRAVYTDRQNNRNEYHVRELYRDEFEALLQTHFPAYRLWGQKLLFQSAIWSLSENPGVGFHQEDGGQIEKYASPRHDPVYFIAVCAAAEDLLPSIRPGLSLFDDAAESVYEHYYHEIRKNMAAGEILAKKERELAELKAALQKSKSAARWWSRLLGKS